MSMRDEFEQWYRDHHGSRDVYDLRQDGEYRCGQVQGAWNVWQAARQAPASGEMEPVEFDYEHPTYCEIIEKISEATHRLLLAAGYDAETSLDADEALEANIFKNIELVAGDVEELRESCARPPAKVPEGVDAAVDMLEDYASAIGNGDLDGAGHSTTQAIYEVISLLTTPKPATTPAAEWVKCHAETAAIALEALQFYAAERFKGFGDDPEPYEHHLAQQAISELQGILPPPPQEQ